MIYGGYINHNEVSSGRIIYDARTKSIAREVSQADYPVGTIKNAELTVDGTLISFLGTTNYILNSAEFSPITDRLSMLSSHGHAWEIG